MHKRIRETFGLALRSGLLLAIPIVTIWADSYATLTGRVLDPSGQAVPSAQILVRNLATLLDQSATTNNQGIYEIPALPVGAYRMQVRAPGFRLNTTEKLTLDVARTVVLDVHLEVGEISDEVIVKSQPPLIDAVTISVGHVIDGRTIQDIPLNGRYFLDLAQLVPGSVTASQTGFSTVPFRGLGALAINTAGNREDAVNYVVNGVTANDPLLNGINFQPSIDTIQEFKIDNSTPSAEYGQNSGAVINVATRSGGSEFHGELFEFFRNDALDGRNFFTLTSSKPPPFKRNQFGGHLDGPIVRGKTFFFLSYEGLRQEQAVNLNSVVLSDAQRLSPGDAVVASLLQFIPRANFIDSAGTSRFITSAPAPVNGDQWGMDISHILTKSDHLHGYYSAYHTKDLEPGIAGTTIPGFGSNIKPLHQFLSLNETHTFGQSVNELRLGVNRLSSATLPNAPLNPADFGIENGIDQPIGLPQINIAGALNFGGPSSAPSGSGRTVFVAGDTITCVCGRLSLKMGVEFRQLLNNFHRQGAGLFNFPSVAAFLADNANSFSVTLGNQSSSTRQGALGLFVQSNYKWRPNLTLELGLRYEWNMTPDERYGRFIVFDPANASLDRVGQGGKDVYHENDRNLEPRLGFAWDPFKDGKTSVRAAYAILVEQPNPYIVVPTAANPPLAVPLTYAGTIQLHSAIDLAQVTGLAPATVDYGFDNAYLQSWNFNVQRELTRGVALMAGYFGSKGTHLTLQRNINQPIDGIRPFPRVSLSSAILPGAPLGNVTQTESTGNSSYNALWVSANRRLAKGLQINASYTWSKSLDYNSLSSMGALVENAYNLRADRGPSDFDARQRLVTSVLYSLPFTGKWFIEGWQAAMVLTSQSGAPVNIVTTNSTFTGVANTLRPDVTGPATTIGNVNRWFDTSVFTAVPAFGDLGRNVVIGPAFNNTDLSIAKNTIIAEKIQVQFRAEFFDVFNHANLGQPGNVVGSPNFGVVTNTRFPTGELGSSRQVQFGIKIIR